MKNNGKLNKDAQSNFHATALSIYMHVPIAVSFEPNNTSRTLLPLSHSDPWQRSVGQAKYREGCLATELGLHESLFGLPNSRTYLKFKFPKMEVS